MPRRIYDYTQYTLLKDLQPMNQFMTICALRARARRRSSSSSTSSSRCGAARSRARTRGTRTRSSGRRPRRRPHENFTGRVPTVHRGPYEYSVPGPRLATTGRRTRRRRRPRRPQGRMADRVPRATRGLHRFAVARRRGDALPDRRGRARHVDRVGPLGARLADDVRPQHVHVPAVEDGRRDPLRAHAPADRLGGRHADGRPGGLAGAAGAAALGAPARLPGRSRRSSRRESSAA